MQPRRNIRNVYSGPGENQHMFLRQLSTSILPRSRPALCRAGFSSSTASSSSSSYLPRFPTPHPRWPGPGFPPWPPRHPHSHISAYLVHSGRAFHAQSVNSGGSLRSFHTSAGLTMEHHDRDREPPYKRKKSVEETEGHRGGQTSSSKREDSSSRPRPNHSAKDGSRDRAGRDVGRTNSKDRKGERTKAGDKDRQTTNGPSHRGRSTHWHAEHKERSRTLTPTPKPTQEEKPTHRPNPWFKERKTEEQGSCERQTKEAEKQLKDSNQPVNPWKIVGTNKEPSPSGTSPPDRQQEEVKPVKPLQRHWEVSPSCGSEPPPPGCSTAFDFTVMSYNILSQDLLLDNAYLYRHCNPSVLPWDHRLPNLLAEIKQYDADILCLQEVQEDHYKNQIKPALQALGYQCEYKKRTGRKPDGCAVIFKTSRLSLLSSNPVEFYRQGDPLLDRDNVGLVLLLQPNDTTGESDSCICVANTHLLYNPRRGDIKLAQLAILLAEINRLCRPPDGLTNPVVLCGDFNSTPWSPLYNFLTTGCLDYRGMQIGMVSGQESSPRGQRLLPSPIWSHSLGIDYQCQYKKPTAESSSSPTVEGAISNLTVEDLATTAAAAASQRARIEHGLKLQSSYKHLLMPDGRPEITTCHSRTAMTVDYIMYTPELITPPSLPGGWSLQLLGRLSLVSQSELKEVNGLPNQHHSSDHLPLLARFRLQQ
ncbi:protein angel homolog 2 isoform X2 [Cheilinus undulatus]|uniref:protein angel homolog 2 isoform X2 n=1 Tax=Cheilinus undulatus TaxID=241271 RepID=UPI001BD1C052|nr:protein angel homolog 2 isoform X2 [Cheilinus undulatus]